VQLSPLRGPRGRKVAPALAAATCALLGPLPSLAAAEQSKKWTFDTAVLYYDEGDRVKDASANLLLQRMYARGRKLVLKFGFDTLTGASASGAAPSSRPQTFTTPSGNETYQIAAGTIPLDPSFLDTRIALAANWIQPLGSRTTVDLGVSGSTEYDYFHAGLNARVSRDFHGHNTTLHAGLAFANDTVDPVGGAPVPLAAMLPPGGTASKRASESKTVADLVVGLTQVLGERTIGQVNYSLSRSAGYLTDPYKLLSVVDPVSGDPDLYLYESRPDSRTKHSLFVEARRRVGSNDVLNGSYRFMTDDWGVDSHTMELRYRFGLRRLYLEPHVRLYTQGAADFYRVALFRGDPLPDHATADYRLGELDTTTLGLKVGRPLGGGGELSLRVELYEQAGRAPPGADAGALGAFDLYPTVDAVIVQVGYRF
jgi:hypothetical protein